MNLDALALRHGTDKSSKYHDYCRIYENLFSPLYNKPITLLEVGVYGGASLRMWKEYFCDGTIIGVDINHECQQHAEERIVIEIADQAKYKTERKLDIVIDDGSHDPDHFRQTFRNLWPNVKPGGYYCIEDLSVCNHASYPKRYAESLTEWLAGDVFSFLVGASRDATAIHMFPKMLVFQK